MKFKDTFRFYHDGIYYEPKCSTDDLDHGVLLVGYGVDKLTGSKYYEVKNSWGKKWGRKGIYFYIIIHKYNILLRVYFKKFPRLHSNGSG